MDGAFDLTHYGHFNALRLGKELGTYLIVGVNSSASVFENKGFAPVLTDEERQTVVEGCRWVDEIVPFSPYVMNKPYLQKMIHERGVDYFAHGSDPCIVDGVDVYEEVRKMGKFMTVGRLLSEGVFVRIFSTDRAAIPTTAIHVDVYEKKNLVTSFKRCPALAASLPRTSSVVSSYMGERWRPNPAKRDERRWVAPKPRKRRRPGRRARRKPKKTKDRTRRKRCSDCT